MFKFFHLSAALAAILSSQIPTNLLATQQDAVNHSLVSQEENQKIEAELQKHQINHRVFRYDAGHGFFAGIFVDKYPYFEQHPSFNFEAAFDAWQQVLELFQTNLKD